MRIISVLVLLATVVSPAFSAKPVTTQMLAVEQLESFLSASRSLKDKELAKQIFDTRLTERLNDEKRALLLKELPGPKSQQALTAIADESEFLDLPPSEVPSQPAPTQTELDTILARAVGYVTSTLHRLPDFYATQLTVTFGGTTTTIPPSAHNTIPELSQLPGDQRLAHIGKSKAVRLYHEGRDTYANERRHEAIECNWQYDPDWTSVAISDPGEFGQILAPVPEIVAQGQVSWSHWERDRESLLAVFHYSAILPFQHEVTCPSVPIPPGNFDYRGEFAVNPDDGSILRITSNRRGMFDWPWLVRPEMEESRISVSYGSVEIGGRTFICPLRAVEIGLAPAFNWQAVAKIFDRQFHLSEDPVAEALNDMTFSNYHMFRSKARILPGLSPVPDSGRQIPLP